MLNSLLTPTIERIVNRLEVMLLPEDSAAAHAPDQSRAARPLFGSAAHWAWQAYAKIAGHKIEKD